MRVWPKYFFTKRTVFTASNLMLPLKLLGGEADFPGMCLHFLVQYSGTIVFSSLLEVEV